MRALFIGLAVIAHSFADVGRSKAQFPTKRDFIGA